MEEPTQKQHLMSYFHRFLLREYVCNLPHLDDPLDPRDPWTDPQISYVDGPARLCCVTRFPDSRSASLLAAAESACKFKVFNFSCMSPTFHAIKIIHEKLKLLSVVS